MLETVLRLKYNTFELGGVADLRPGAPQYAVQSEAAKANARGLVITHHHTSPLGSNLSSWDAFWRHEGKEVPPLSVGNIENLKTFWRYHVETAQRAGFEVVWTLVFRGSHDIPVDTLSVMGLHQQVYAALPRPPRPIGRGCLTRCCRHRPMS